MRKHIQLNDDPGNEQELVVTPTRHSGVQANLACQQQELQSLMYNNLNTAADISQRDDSKRYAVSCFPGAGYFFIKRKDTPLTEGNSNYKVHISVDNNDLQKSWNAIIPQLIQADIAASFKVYDGRTPGFQSGKHIVIYTNIYDNVINNSLKNWQDLLSNIDQTLQSEGIRHGVPSCFRFGDEVTNINEPKFEQDSYCYIRRTVKAETTCCGFLVRKSEKELITEMSQQERGGLLTRQPTSRLQM